MSAEQSDTACCSRCLSPQMRSMLDASSTFSDSDTLMQRCEAITSSARSSFAASASALLLSMLKWLYCQVLLPYAALSHNSLDLHNSSSQMITLQFAGVGQGPVAER